MVEENDYFIQMLEAKATTVIVLPSIAY